MGNIEEESSKTPQTKSSTPDATNTEWDICNAKIIQVPADGLCMYHCVNAASYPDWMTNRNISGMSLDKHREKEDAAKAQALRKQVIAYLAAKGTQEAAKRLAIAGSNGRPTTDEMPHLAEMLHGNIELVDLGEPECPMTTYGEVGPVLFRIAHQNIAQDISYKCDLWVLIDMGPTARKETKLGEEV